MQAKRVGRGIGSGLGKTAGRGHKGQNARTGTSALLFPLSARRTSTSKGLILGMKYPTACIENALLNCRAEFWQLTSYVEEVAHFENTL